MLAGSGQNRAELLQITGGSDLDTGAPFPFGATQAVADLSGFEHPDRIALAFTADKLLLLDTNANFIYEVDPFTGESTRITRIQIANPGIEITKPDEDFDGDGVPNGVDLCPRHVSTLEDRDEDGVGDLCDNCPDTPNPRINEFFRPYHMTTTGSQPDGDGDGIGDACDCDFTNEGSVCNVGDLLHILQAFGNEAESSDGCLNAPGNPGPCAPYDMNTTQGRVNVGDLLQFLERFGSAPSPCPVCPYQCSGAGCPPILFSAIAMTWDPVGGPVWNTSTGLETRPRLFVTRSGVSGIRGIFAAHAEGPRRFVLYPYAPLARRTEALAFDPYPRSPFETSHKTLYGTNLLGFWERSIETLDQEILAGLRTLPLNLAVDAVTKSVSHLAASTDSNFFVFDDLDICGGFEVDLDFEDCDLNDPNDIQEGVIWEGDRCRGPLSFCGCTGDDCARLYPDLDTCYTVHRKCSVYCAPLSVEVAADCAPGSDVSGFTWDGAACVPFQGCCAGADCDVLFPTQNDCEAAFLQPRDTEVEPFPLAPCPNFYRRATCQPEAQAGICEPDDPRLADGYLWTGTECEEKFDFCCEGQDCDISLFAYDPLPALLEDNPDLTPEQKARIARSAAQSQCELLHLPCPGICDVRSEFREGVPPELCDPDEVFINGYIWQLVPFPFNVAGERRDCLLIRGCCRGPDCLQATPADPGQSEPANTRGECLSAFPLPCQGVADTAVVLSLFFERAGGPRGRLIGLDPSGNLFCVNPEFPGTTPVASTMAAVPERTLSEAVLVANFDLNEDRQVNIDDVCALETAVQTGAGPCEPDGPGDPITGPCATYPAGQCSATADLNRDTRVDDRDLDLIERRVGQRCDGSPVP
jgi:hypothetical protein